MTRVASLEDMCPRDILSRRFLTIEVRLLIDGVRNQGEPACFSILDTETATIDVQSPSQKTPQSVARTHMDLSK